MRNLAAVLGVLFLLSSCGGGGGSEVAPGAVLIPDAPPAPGVTPSVPAAAQIEFLIQGNPLGVKPNEQMNIDVRAPYYPGACMVRIAGVCSQPTSVTISLESDMRNAFDEKGNSVQGEDLFNIYNQPKKGPPYIGVFYASNYYKGENRAVMVKVTAKTASGETVERQGFIFTDFSQPFEAGFFGASDLIQVSPNAIVNISTPGSLSPRTGSPVIVQGALTGNSTNVRYAYSVAAAPLGSTAGIALDPVSNYGVFMPDKPGEYVVALAAVDANGRTTYPAYKLVRVFQASTEVNIRVSPTPNLTFFPVTPVFESPRALQNTSRIYVSAAKNDLISNIVSVQGVLDGVVLGTLSQPNVTRNDSSGKRTVVTSFFAFDVAHVNLGNSTHNFIANVINDKGVTYPVALSFSKAGTGEFIQQNFKE